MKPGAAFVVLTYLFLARVRCTRPELRHHQQDKLNLSLVWSGARWTLLENQPWSEQLDKPARENTSNSKHKRDSARHRENSADVNATAERMEEAVAGAQDGDEPCREDVVHEFVVTNQFVHPDVRDEVKYVTDLSKTLASVLDRNLESGQDTINRILETTLPARQLWAGIAVTGRDEPKTRFVYRQGRNIVSMKKSPGPVSDVVHYSSWTPLFHDCLMRSWVFGYSVPFRQNRMSVRVFFTADAITGNVNQCLTAFHHILNGGPKCDVATTQCAPIDNAGLVLGGYKCVCSPGFYFPEVNLSSPRYYKGSDLEGNIQGGNLSYFRCVPCPDTCPDSCTTSGLCSAQSNHLLRNVILGVQFSCILITLVLVVLVCKHRKCKTIATGMWIIMEMILIGSIILYGTLIVRAFYPSTKLCLLEPWCREIGFVICYGAIILKLYRILIEFRTRKAHRWVVRDKDLLKYLLGMFVVVLGYMAAWTAINLDLIKRENYDMVTTGVTEDGVEFMACKAVWWDYVTETGEILILIFGVHLSYASRNASTQFQERFFLCFAISVEAVISSVFYVLRFSYWETIHPDMSFVAHFARSQLTTTIVLLLIFTPKWWYQQFRVGRTSRMSRNYLMPETGHGGQGPLEAFKPRDGVTATNSDIEGEINLADMNPEDIREELKRLYTQLEVLKNKTIRLDNPHISKRRGGRKIAHRRFSLQKKGSREKQALRHQNQRLSAKQPPPAGEAPEPTEAEPSRTPEDSVCSNEGPSIVINDGTSEVTHTTPKKHQQK